MTQRFWDMLYHLVGCPVVSKINHSANKSRGEKMNLQKDMKEDKQNILEYTLSPCWVFCCGGGRSSAAQQSCRGQVCCVAVCAAPPSPSQGPALPSDPLLVCLWGHNKEKYSSHTAMPHHHHPLHYYYNSTTSYPKNITTTPYNWKNNHTTSTTPHQHKAEAQPETCNWWVLIYIRLQSESSQKLEN